MASKESLRCLQEAIRNTDLSSFNKEDMNYSVILDNDIEKFIETSDLSNLHLLTVQLLNDFSKNRLEAYRVMINQLAGNKLELKQLSTTTTSFLSKSYKMESEQIKSDTNMLSSSIYDILQQNLFFDEITNISHSTNEAAIANARNTFLTKRILLLENQMSEMSIQANSVKGEMNDEFMNQFSMERQEYEQKNKRIIRSDSILSRKSSMDRRIEDSTERKGRGEGSL